VVYATSAQAITLYGEDYIAICCDRDEDGTLDTASFDAHLQVASDEIDAYLLGRYDLPLASPPAHFQKLCTDIAVYNAAPTADVRTDEMKTRYEAAIRFMELVASNRVKLKTDTDTTEANESVTPQIQTKSSIVPLNCDRQMRRDKLRSLL
jgi:phage gp36-like protein